MINELDKSTTKIFSKLIKLEYLDLKSNLINAIDSYSFQKLISLKTLNLNDNMIKFLENNTFDALINLKILRLNNNHINNIDGLFDKTLLLEIINLSKNNLIGQRKNMHAHIKFCWPIKKQRREENVYLCLIDFLL
jgi:Leucine-rich repeat (LRR) protein